MEENFKLKSGNKTSFKEMGSSPAKFIYGKKKTSVDDSGAVTTTRKNLLTGGTKTTTEYTKKGMESLGTDEGSTKVKTVQRSNKSKIKIKVKKKITETLPDHLPGKKRTATTTIKSKYSNYKGTDDYKIQSQSVKTKGAFGRSKKKNTAGGVGNIDALKDNRHEGFKDPRQSYTKSPYDGEWKPENERNIPSYNKKRKK